MVYLSFPTEKGTLYSKRELSDISSVCRKYGMYLFVDGARMGYGLGAENNDLTLRDFAELTDVFYRRDKMRCAVWRSAGDHRSRTQIPLQGIYEAEGRRAGKGLADGAAICAHAGERRVF